jgi:ribosomal protein S18 acetylase RimI-like enzyme
MQTAYGIHDQEKRRFAASFESPETTLKRISEGECYLAFLNDVIVGCIVLRLSSKVNSPAWYRQSGVAHFGRFAVLPSLQRNGIGSLLLSHIEERAKALGFSEIALDTAENADELIRMYEKRGYRVVSEHQWRATPFTSVVLSKKL